VSTGSLESAPSTAPRVPSVAPAAPDAEPTRLGAATQDRLIVGRSARRWLTTPSGRRDAVAFGAVYLAYSLTRYVSSASTATAVAHARHIERLERSLHLGIEAQVQAIFNHGPIPDLFNYVYLCAQVFVIPGVLLVLYFRGPRRVYRGLRDTVLVSWLLALPVYAFYPTAPPRLAGLGIIDTVSQESIIHLNARLTTRLFNPYASVPSMHAGLAVAISVALIIALRHHQVLRILAGLWGPLMCVDVMATGNHFLFDIATGLILTAAGFAVSVLASRALDGSRSARLVGAEPQFVDSTALPSTALPSTVLSCPSASTKETST
jgi:PAP2 superfamily